MTDRIAEHAATEADLRDALVAVLDNLDPATAPQACCEAALALDVLIDPTAPPPLAPVGPPVDVADELVRARELATALLDRATSVTGALALGSCGRHLRAAVDSLPSRP